MVYLFLNEIFHYGYGQKNLKVHKNKKMKVKGEKKGGYIKNTC